MASEAAFHGFVEATKDLFVLLREGCIVTLFVLVLFMPKTFQKVLGRVGISKVTTPFGDIDVRNTGEKVASVSRGITDGVAVLQQLQTQITDPVKKQKLQDLTTSLTGLQQQAHDADADIKVLVGQQAAAQVSAPQAAPAAGWVFLGHVDDSKQKWSGEGAKNISSEESPALKTGDRFTIATAAYLYSDAPSGHHLEGTVAGVLPAGTQVQVIEDPQYSHALAGGDFLWVKVSRVQ